MDEKSEQEVTIIAPSPIASMAEINSASMEASTAVVARDAEAWWHKWKKDGDTEAWLKAHVHVAHAWWRLWRADKAALELAIAAAESLAPSSRDRIITEHGAAERSASLWYLSELLRAEQRTLTALAAHDAPRATVERLTAVLGRLKDLAREVRAVTAP